MWPSLEASPLPQRSPSQSVWPDWAIYWTLSNFLKPLATINLPKSPTFLGNFCKGVEIFIFLVRSFLGNCYRHLAIFSGHTAHNRLNPTQRQWKWDLSVTSPNGICKNIRYAYADNIISGENIAKYNSKLKVLWPLWPDLVKFRIFGNI